MRGCCFRDTRPKLNFLEYGQELAKKYNEPPRNSKPHGRRSNDVVKQNLAVSTPVSLRDLPKITILTRESYPNASEVTKCAQRQRVVTTPP